MVVVYKAEKKKKKKSVRGTGDRKEGIENVCLFSKGICVFVIHQDKGVSLSIRSFPVVSHQQAGIPSHQQARIPSLWVVFQDSSGASSQNFVG